MTSEPPARILIVEDEPIVRSVTCKLLSAAGYDCVAAADGREALVMVRNADRRVALVLTDVVMPMMTGIELHAELARFAPGLPVLFTSAYPDVVLLDRGFDTRQHRFIRKPFDFATLREAVDSIVAPRR